MAIFTLIMPITSYAGSIGPYSGSVIDGQTGEPIEGASVFLYWTKLVPRLFEAGSEMIDLRMVYTGKKGRYEIPSLFAGIGPGGRLESTVVIIYEPGYQAYIKTIWHDNLYSEPDQEFKEQNNMVKLRRIPPNFDHYEHYQAIEHALWGIDEYHSPSPAAEDSGTTREEWNKMIVVDQKTIPDKRELLRRAEWEYRLGAEEKYGK